MRSESCKVGLGRFATTVWLLAALLVVFTTGCGGGFDAEASIKAANSTNAQRLSTLYVNYGRQHKSGPKDEETFREFVAGVSKKLLERIDVDPTQIDELFISERDGEPLKIRYGIKCGPFDDPQPVVFEQTGDDEGKRIVAWTSSTFEEVEEQARYDELLNSK